jgi:hypothetical protein
MISTSAVHHVKELKHRPNARGDRKLKEQVQALHVTRQILFFSFAFGARTTQQLAAVD